MSNHRRTVVYARVSTNDQDADVQLHALREYAQRCGWTLTEEYVDRGHSGAKDRRPALDRLMADVRRGRIDAVVVWKFDRFARSVKHLVTALAEFQSMSVDFISITEAIDTSTPLGRAMFAIVGAISEFERELIKERVKAGVAKAKASGKRLGRPRAALDLDAARARIDRGDGLRAVARSLGIHHATLGRALAREGGAETFPSAPVGASAQPACALA